MGWYRCVGNRVWDFEFPILQRPALLLASAGMLKKPFILEAGALHFWAEICCICDKHCTSFLVSECINLLIWSWAWEFKLVILNCYSTFQVSDSRYHVSDFNFQILEFRFQNSDFRFHMSDSRFQISYFSFVDFVFQFSDSGSQISNFIFHILDSRFQISDSMFQNPYFRIRIPDTISISDFGFHISYFGFHISCFRFQISDSGFQISRVSF